MMIVTIGLVTALAAWATPLRNGLVGASELAGAVFLSVMA